MKNIFYVNLKSIDEYNFNVSDLRFDDVQVGDFILAKFLGGKIQTSNYIPLYLDSSIPTEADIEVILLK